MVKDIAVLRHRTEGAFFLALTEAATIACPQPPNQLNEDATASPGCTEPGSPSADISDGDERESNLWLVARESSNSD